MAVTAQMVKELRARTGAGMKYGKKALTSKEDSIKKTSEVL